MNKPLKITVCVAVALLATALLYNSFQTEELRDSYHSEKIKVTSLLDSLASERSSRKSLQDSLNLKLDSVSSLYASSKVSLSLSQRKYNTLLASYRDKTSLLAGTDSVSVEDCNLVVDAAQTHIEGLNTSLALCDSASLLKSSVIRQLTLDTLSYSRSLRELEIFSRNQDVLINSYRNKKPSWWTKNKFWLGLISGVVVTSTGAVLLTK